MKNIYNRGHDKNKLFFWPQYAEEFYIPLDKGKYMKDEMNSKRFKIVFAGNIGYAQGLDILIDTAEILKKENAQVIFYLIGDGKS